MFLALDACPHQLAKQVNLMQVPAAALSLHLQKIWQIITEQKDLDLPAHKVMVAHIRCKDIAREQLQATTSDQAWEKLLSEATEGNALVPDFSERAASLMSSCLFGYDSDAMYFVESVRSEQKGELEKALLGQLHSGFTAQRAVLQQQHAAEFRARLDAAARSASHDVVSAAKSAKSELLAQYTGTPVIEHAMILCNSQSVTSDYTAQHRHGQLALTAHDSKHRLFYLQGCADTVRQSLLVPGSGWPDGAAQLSKELDDVQRHVRDEAVRACEHRCLEEMDAAVDGPGWLVITKLPTDLWVQLRAIVKQALKHGVTTVDAELEGYGCVTLHLHNCLQQPLVVQSLCSVEA